MYSRPPPAWEIFDSGSALEEIRYEGYGLSGVAIVMAIVPRLSVKMAEKCISIDLK